MQSGAVPFTPEKRARWPTRWAFIIASVGSAVGLGNVWRFPFLSYRHGGGAFLIPYILFLFVMALPMVQTELALGAILLDNTHGRVYGAPSTRQLRAYAYLSF